jgi:HAD superfamily hydrolase (TIGR01509 family)
MKALIFDCDGVLADTERDGHLPAFNQTFREYGFPVQWSEAEYGVRLKIGGGKERMASMLTPEFVAQAGLPSDPDKLTQLINEMHKRKSAIYKEMVIAGRLPGRPGVRRLVIDAVAGGWAMAVASTSAEESVRAVLEHVVGPDLAVLFLVLAGDIVPKKKPAPDIYLLALKTLGISPQEGIVVEDSRNGLEAANSAELRCLVTLSGYTRDEDMAEALLVVSDLGEPGAPMEVIANRSKAKPGSYVTRDDLDALLESTRPAPSASPGPVTR